ncbi:DEAD/DEAH box helicase [Tepidibacter formicigenes]|uniref:Superfamily II DNA and RNA helicase n=1 Tax=Tepidibacter formicigenes DSM 15518 TaxID=1123349 RepID=A0A1M6JF11_9FIRM|nr:DEAD/DEAH box helicase [Tepidibacter formicigenes]SHJ45297.1 Superfamily II DNA and RNA helicase [Tepidibacter formicigenes DSM 15518]
MGITFKDYNLKEFIINNLANANITKPSEVQDKTIPLILDGKDVIGKARTGTGKTLAYLLPMIEKIDPKKRDLQMLVLAPSRELGLQIQREAEGILLNTDIRIQAIVEGMDLNKQLDKLKQKPHLVIATPGRLLHIIGLKKIKMHKIKIVALDEVDQILDQGLGEKVQAIIKTTLKERQLLSFSATISKEAEKILNKLMKAPTFVNLDNTKPIPSGIEHQYIISKSPKKTDTLVELLKTIKPKKSLVFINKNENVDRFVKSLHKLGFSVGGIQTRSKNQDRQHLLASFKKGKLKILVTTDLFTRGMDFQDVTHIFNMDLPLNKTDYLHRAGRTGRMNKKGVTINIIRDREKFIMYKMMKYLNISVKPITIINKKIVPVEKIIQKKRR